MIAVKHHYFVIKLQEVNDVTRALLYAVTVSYYARLTDRPPFLKAIVQHFTTPYCLPGKNEEEKCSFFEDEIMRYILSVILYRQIIIFHKSSLICFKFIKILSFDTTIFVIELLNF